MTESNQLERCKHGTLWPEKVCSYCKIEKLQRSSALCEMRLTEMLYANSPRDLKLARIKAEQFLKENT